MYTPRLPLRVLPVATNGRGTACRDDADRRQGSASCVLELVVLDMILLMLDVVLKVGVLEGRGSPG